MSAAVTPTETFRASERDDVLIVRLIPRLFTYQQADEFDEQIMDPSIWSGRNVVIDFKNVCYLHSLVLKTLSNLRREILESGGSLRLAEMQMEVNEVFGIARLHKVFDTFSTMADAVNAPRK